MTLTKAKDAAVPADKKKMSWGLFVLILVVISAAFYFGVVSRQWNKVGAGKEWDVERAQQDFDARNNELSRLKMLLAHYQDLSANDIDLASRLLPQKQDIPELLTQLELIARQNGVNILSLTTAELKEDAAQPSGGEGGTAQPKQPLPYKQLSVKMELDVNDYQSWKSFLDSVQSHARLMDVESFSFDLGKEQQSMSLKTYFLL